MTRYDGNLQEHPELVPRRREVDKNHLFQQETSHLSVAPVVRASQDHSELVSKVIQTLHSRLQTPDLLSSQQQLDTVRQERVVVFSLHETLENFLVASINQPLKNKHEGNHVFDFAPSESKRGTTRVEVVDRVRHGRLVRSDTTDLASVCRISSSSFRERRSVQVERVMATGKNEVSDEFFVSVDNKVSSERGGFFAVLDKLGRREFAQVTSDRLALAR